jgi:type II secretory pathway component PulM
VKFWSTSRHPRWGGKLAVAGVMLLLWVGTFALTVSPELHHLLHRDSQSPNHNCLVTQIQQHPLLAGVAAITAPVPAPAAVAAACPAEVQFHPAFDYRLSPSRAPPFFFSSLTVVG